MNHVHRLLKSLNCDGLWGLALLATCAALLLLDLTGEHGRILLRYDRAAQELISEEAGLAYPIRDGIPIMLVDEARPLRPEGTGETAPKPPP